MQYICKWYSLYSLYSLCSHVFICPVLLRSVEEGKEALHKLKETGAIHSRTYPADFDRFQKLVVETVDAQQLAIDAEMVLVAEGVAEMAKLESLVRDVGSKLRGMQKAQINAATRRNM